MNSFNSHNTAGRPGMLGLREALGPGFAIVAASEATLRAATGQPRRHHGRPTNRH